MAAPLRQSPGGIARGEDVDVPALVRDLATMIEEARKLVAVVADATLATLYWEIGRRVHQDILEGQRAEYGGRIVATLGRQLAERYGSGFGEKNLRRMIQFGTAFPDAGIVAALRRQLIWGHFKTLIPIADQLKRDFYAEMCRVERWSTRELRERIDSMLCLLALCSKIGCIARSSPHVNG